MTWNDLSKTPPAAACARCGGWTNYGGMSQYSTSVTPVFGRTGCTGPHVGEAPQKTLSPIFTGLAARAS